MSVTEKNSREFVGYEYREIATDSSRISFLTDGYRYFGWEPDENPGGEKNLLRLKRNRRITNRAELTRLQRNFEGCLGEIEKLEKAKTSAAAIYAMTIGIAGTIFMAGSVFAVTADPPRIALCALLAIPGIIGWVAPYFVYRWTAEKRIKQIEPLIEGKYEEIYEIFEKGSRLL